MIQCPICHGKSDDDYPKVREPKSWAHARCLDRKVGAALVAASHDPNSTLGQEEGAVT